MTPSGQREELFPVAGDGCRGVELHRGTERVAESQAHEHAAHAVQDLWIIFGQD
jgi:hypothetical protein